MSQAKEAIEKRIQEIEATIQQVLANHAKLLGHLDEAKFMLQTIFKNECETAAAPAEPVSSEVLPTGTEAANS